MKTQKKKKKSESFIFISYVLEREREIELNFLRGPENGLAHFVGECEEGMGEDLSSVVVDVELGEG